VHSLIIYAIAFTTVATKSLDKDGNFFWDTVKIKYFPDFILLDETARQLVLLAKYLPRNRKRN
jgi:hypothetical protein